VTLIAGGSDPQGGALTFAWDLDGDGEYDDATGTGIDFSANTPNRDGDGAYDVAVRVSDATGISVVAETTVTVRNVAPQVSAGGDVSLDLGGVLSRVGSFTDPGPDTWTATVDYGDGSGAVTLALAGSDFTLDHVYVDPGSFAVVVTVTDDDGGVGSASFQVEVGTVEDQIGSLIDDVEELLDDGTLKLGQGKSLIGKLELALYMLKWGNIKKAITMLEAFIQEVEAFIRSGKLTPEQGNPLIAKAQAAIASLG